MMIGSSLIISMKGAILSCCNRWSSQGRSKYHLSWLSRSFSESPTDAGNGNHADREHDTDINYVRSAMKTWVKDYIVEHELCPFAHKSNYRIVIWPKENVHESSNGVSVHEFIKDEVEDLLVPSHDQHKKRPNTLIVFPFVRDFSNFYLFDRFYVGAAEAIPGAGDQLAIFDPLCKVQFFPFHRDLNWRFHTPWPTLHLLRRYDLDKTRKGSDLISTAISEKNDQTIASLGTKEKLAKLVVKLAKFPDPIRLIKATSPKQKAIREKLHREGVRVEEVGPGDVPMEPLVFKHKSSNKRKGKRKKR